SGKDASNATSIKRIQEEQSSRAWKIPSRISITSRDVLLSKQSKVCNAFVDWQVRARPLCWHSRRPTCMPNIQIGKSPLPSTHDPSRDNSDNSLTPLA